MPRTKSTKASKPKPLLPKVKCKGCFLYFHPSDNRQKFHSASCRNRYYNLTYFHAQVVEKFCENPDCKKTFTTSCPVKQKFCSPECRSHYQLNYLPVKQKSQSPGKIEGAEGAGGAGGAKETGHSDQQEPHTFKCVACGKTELDGVLLRVHRNAIYCVDCLLKT